MDTDAQPQAQRFQTFAEFYPFYLGEHSQRTTRRLHFVGTTLGTLSFIFALLTMNLWFVLLGLLIGYGFAWVSHFFVEKNRPATFKYPLYSFAGDYVMYKDILTGKIPF
jgi:hypothetical protein